MKHPNRATVAALFMLAMLSGCASTLPRPTDPQQQVMERALVRELMDRYGVVHDSGTADEYADLFTADGQIASGGRVLVKGREALLAQARRDHDRYGETDANGRWSSIMRHLISNAQVKITGPGTAEGTCYVTTVVKKGDIGPAILSISRYVDRYVKVDGQWRIQHREIALEFGNSELAAKTGIGR